MDNNHVDVCLVEMPFSSYAMPSYSLSILKACLLEENIGARVFYGSMRFASLCGVKDYLTVLQKGNQYALSGEAIFASLLNLPLRYSFEEYLADYRRYAPQASEQYIEDMRATLTRVHDKAEGFLNDLAEEILSYTPKVVGMSDVFFQHNACLALARILKEQDPSLVVIIGGSNCMGEGGAAVAAYIPWVDYTFSGEADECFAEFCHKAIKFGSCIPESDLPYGVFAASLAQECLSGKKDFSVRLTKNLDLIPAPDYGDYFRELKIFSLDKEVICGMFYEFSRGCWWHEKKPCTFCGLNGGVSSYRVKSEEKILHDLYLLRELYGLNRISLTDNILSQEHIRSLLPKLAGKGFSFFAEIKSNQSAADMMAFRNSGFGIVQPGIESLNDDVLTLMNKGNRAIKHLEFLRDTQEQGIYAVWHMLAGFPYEEDEWYEAMVSLIPKITHFAPPKQFLHILFSKYSEYYNNMEKYDLNLRPVFAYHYVYPAISDYITRTAYMFEPSDEKKLSEYYSIQLKSAKHRLLYEKIQQWKTSYALNKDCLEMKYVAESIEILDLRRGTSKSVHLLSGVYKLAYELCRTVIRIEKLKQILLKEFKKEDVEAAIDYLLFHNLCVEISGEILALAMQTLKPTYFLLNDLPIGLHKLAIEEGRGFVNG